MTDKSSESSADRITDSDRTVIRCCWIAFATVAVICLTSLVHKLMDEEVLLLLRYFMKHQGG